MRPHPTALGALLVSLVIAPGAASAQQVDFAHDVMPLLKQRCAKCHTSGTYKAGLSLDTREALVRSEGIVPGKADQSELIARVTADDPEERMPPAPGLPLKPEEVDVLRRWVDQGAPWLEGFSFAKGGSELPIKPRPVDLPPAREGRDGPVDRLVAAYLAKNKVAWPDLVDDAGFLRRVSLDLVGLLPTPAQLDAFLADGSADKRGRKVRELLGDDQAYAEHWITFWNDLLRNDYAGTGYIDGGRKAITPWLYAALKENVPYDRFVRELISPTPDSEGFIKGIKWRGVVNASQVPEVQFAQNVGQVFLGVNLKCASCHDSFIDSWKLDDTYGLAAIIADEPLEMHRCDKPLGKKAEARFLFPEIGRVDPALPRVERLKQTAALLTAPEDGLLARTIVNRLWHRLLGRGIVHPVDVMANPPFDADLLDWLANDLVAHHYDLKHTLATIVNSGIYQSRCRQQEAEPGAADYVFHGPVARRMPAEQFIDAVWTITGTAPDKPSAPFARKDAPVRASLVVADPLMRALGRPNREQVVTTRPEDLTTLQALELTNGQELVELIEKGAKHLRAQVPDGDADALALVLFRAALSRPPTADERATARAILGPSPDDGTVGDLLWSVFMLPGFQLIQ
jgi:hypothetical protein